MAQPLVGIARLAHAAPLIEAKRVVSYSQLATFELLNRCSSARMPFAWTINPYRGCEFACKYCYARYTHEFMEFHDPFEFENRIFAKQWNPAAFRQKLRKIDRRESIALGTATDPYQPAERRYGLTRSILEVFAAMPGYRLSITTKSDLIARDVDVLKAIAKHSELSVNMTLTTVDTELARKLEPRAARPDLRLEAMRTLTAAGISCGTLCCPVMPLINDKESQLDAVASATRAAGAGWFVANPLFLTAQPKQVFFEFIRNEFPQLAAKYGQAFAHTPYLREAYKEKIRERVHAIRARHGFGPRGGAWEDKELLEPQMMLPLGIPEANAVS
ncbi:MAG: radical SAM protein [Bryobacterales bacterium]|nr:radical SAM protein [Bryobacterales bacterium]